jgi:methylenetetrahydrofolate dehydrogenase (NADP+)/methenyltetrahydrofolate cyclohydrolase
MQAMDGKALAAEIRTGLADTIRKLKEQTGRVPGLTVVIVGEDPASRGYVRSKHKTASELGINSRILELPETVAPARLIDEIHNLNQDGDVHALLVQLPLPGGMKTWEILNHMDPEKDVDRFLPVNLGRIMLNETSLFPCTPAGILALLDRYRIEVTGMNAVVVGRSFIVGKPIAAMLTNRNATVTICHSKTRNLDALVGEADLLVAAIGRAGFITADMVKPGAVLIDVGTNYLHDREEVEKHCSPIQKKRFEKKGYGIAGDIERAAYEKAAHHTPVPGGVGPMTVTMLMANTVELFKRQLNSS